ncbi:MAG: Cof-type HAD-IIB family hydrolase [Treponema sp.]|nr:Cof-type HAD-IIB family hydrolase [Treponema sp.]
MNKTFNPKLIKALAIDLDGTLLMPGAVLGERTINCIKRLMLNGMQVMISTGRAIEAAERFRAALGAEGPMVFFNGAEVADVPSGKVLYTNMINLDVVNYGAEIARELDVHFQVFLPAGISPQTGREDPAQKWETLLIDNYNKDAEMYQKHTGIIPVVMDFQKISAMPDVKGCVKGMYVADPSKHDDIRKKMADRFGGNINIFRSLPTFLEIINAGVSKGEGLKIAMRHRGLNPQEVIAFGDEENDLPMFSVVGFSAAPESAREQIRDAADFVFGSNADEGLAVWLEERFL